MEYDVIIVGGGLTGLTTAFFLKQKGFKPLVLEKNDRVGGAIQSHQENGFVYEEGPNTGVISNPEVIELFEKLGLEPEIANADAEKRLILKDNKWHPLPSDAIGFFRTPLFRFSDKVKIMFEPFRKKGTDPDETIASLATRRIGQSFVDYAVNPFIAGIYAGDPDKLVTRYALPKLYQLEQTYGSFIRGAIKKAKEPKSDREKKATRKVFSGIGGFSTLIQALEMNIGKENIVCEAKKVTVEKIGDSYEASYLKDGKSFRLRTQRLISTVGAHALSDIFPFLQIEDMNSISELNYAKVIQVAVGVNRSVINDKYISFGGLIPQKEDKRILGILFPSFCFANRAPEGFSTLAIYLGGTRHAEYINLSDKEIEKIVIEELQDLLQIPSYSISFMKIFRHPYAIPQYEKSSGKRFRAVDKIQRENPGLIIAGNLRDGIGIADRIKQAYNITENIS